MFDPVYNAYSSDELFFVSALLFLLYLTLTPFQFKSEFGGQPWSEKSKALAEKFVVSPFRVLFAKMSHNLQIQPIKICAALVHA